MRNDEWLTFLRKIGLCVTVEKEKFKALCKYIESGKCHNKCINASSILVKYLFQEEIWYEDEQFLTEVSTIAFVVANEVPRLSWIKDCAPPGNTIQIGEVSVKLTSFSKSAEIRNAPLIWTVKPVVHLSRLSCEVQNRQKVKMELLSHLNISNITAAWGHHQLPEGPASKLTEYIVQSLGYILVPLSPMSHVYRL